MKVFLIILMFVIYGCSNLNPMKMNQNAEGFNWDDNFISIMQGPATQTSTIINFIVPKNLKYEVMVFEKIGKKVLENAVKSEKISTRSYSPWKVVEVEISNLQINTNYLFVVNLFSGKNSISEVREFSTLDTKSSDLKFLVASCMSDAYSYIGNVAWPSILKNDPQFYLLIGDQVYVDIYAMRYLNIPADERQIWQRYISARNSLALYRQQKLKPVYAIWDDHDYGQNNGDKNYQFKTEAKKIMRTFFPLANYENIKTGPGVSFNLTLGKQNFYFLDNRTFRDTNEIKEGEHFGQEQTQWFFSELKKSNQQNGHWIITGDQFFGGYHQFESFEGNHPEKFNQFLEKIKSSDKKVIFVSGDRHLAELMKIESDVLGHQTYEITSSGLHAHIFPGSLTKALNKRRIDGVDNRYNFAIIESKNEDNHLKIWYKAMSQSNLTILNHKLFVK